MPKFTIKFRGTFGNNTLTLDAENRRDAMLKFNKKFKYNNFELKEIIPEETEEDHMEVDKVNKNSLSLEEFKKLQVKKNEEYDKTLKMLDETNEILFEQLKKFKDLDLSDKEQAGIEIAKNNSLAGTAKTIVQSVSIKMIVEKSKGII